MKVLPFVIPKPEHNALIYQVDKEKQFYDKLHQHEEIQLSYILEGYGTLVVGDAIHQYSEGDFIVIGSNLPHVFKSDSNSPTDSHMSSLFFTKSSFGNNFFELGEFENIKPFFETSKYGFKIIDHKADAYNLYSKLEKASKLKRFIILLELLDITLRSEIHILSSLSYKKSYSDHEGERMRKVFEHTLNSYKRPISLAEISEIATMTKHAFCKYFKKRTNKTYIQFVNELRVQNACRLLLEKRELSIAEIADLSGFGTISNFNKQFLKLKKSSPSDYKKLKERIS